MNERFRLLADQAGLRFTQLMSNPMVPVVDGRETDLEKFADLIVRECVTVMYDDAIERKVPPDINQTPTHYAVAVLEHFGVKE